MVHELTLARLELKTDGRNTLTLRFYYLVISCVLARRGVRHGAAEASGSGGVQCVWAW